MRGWMRRLRSKSRPRDPDFKLSAVRLHGEAAGQSVLDESLLKAEHRGRFTARYSFVPNAHGLKAGDVVAVLGRGR